MSSGKWRQFCLGLNMKMVKHSGRQVFIYVEGQMKLSEEYITACFTTIVLTIWCHNSERNLPLIRLGVSFVYRNGVSLLGSPRSRDCTGGNSSALERWARSCASSTLNKWSHMIAIYASVHWQKWRNRHARRCLQSIGVWKTTSAVSLSYRF